MVNGKSDAALSAFLAMWPAETAVTGQKEIARGQANDGVYLYYLSCSIDTEGGRESCPRKVVRKRTANTQEYVLAKALERARRTGQQPRTFPDIYMARRTMGRADLFLEYVPGVGSRPSSLKPHHARAIASSLGDVRAMDFLPLEKVESGTLLKARARRMRAWNDMGFPRELGLMDSDALFWEARSRLKGTNTVISHNDIGWPNCSLKKREGASARFIDFALMGYNTEGADLHHMLRDAITEGGWPFFVELVGVCSRKWRVNQEVLWAGCAEFAIYRGFQRIQRFLKAGNRDKAVKESVWLRELPAKMSAVQTTTAERRSGKE